MRNILHCDMNNFYASVECMLDPTLKKYPIAVCGSVEEDTVLCLRRITRQKHLMSKRAMQYGKPNRSAKIW